MIIEGFLFVLGLALLVKGSDYFVKAAAAIAKRLGVSELVIGLTLVAFGTSVPELASSVAASFIKDSGLIIGNVIGSNVANIGLIVGVAASIHLVKIRKGMLKRDGYIMIFAAFLFLAFIFDGIISRWESIIFIILYLAYMLFLFEKKKKDHIGEFIRYFFGFKYLATIKSKVYNLNNKRKIKSRKKVKKFVGRDLAKDFLVVVLSGVTIVLGAKFLVKEAVFFAGLFGVPSNVIGISLVAVGTSLPELVVSVVAARKGFGNIAVGNVIGSNVANIFLVLGVAGIIFPLEIIKSTLFFTAPAMIGFSILLLIFMRTGWKIRKGEGAALLLLYILFMALLFFNGVY